MQTLSNDAILAIHNAWKIAQLARVVFREIEAVIDIQGTILALQPQDFELPGLCSRPSFQPIFDRYLRTDHKLDIWLQQSPVHPRVTVVRHSDYTPHAQLIRTKFYRRILAPMPADWGASLVVWRASTWLATFTAFRDRRQGDFSDDDIAFLRALRVHVAPALKRIAARQEHHLAAQALETFAGQSRQGVLILDWRLNLLFSNRAARPLVRRWTGLEQKRGELRLPADWRTALVEMQPAIAAARPNRPLAPRHIELPTLHQDRGERLIARISFVPARKLALSKGTFLIVVSEMESGPPAHRPGFDRLTPREAACVKHIAQGLSNPAIARKLGVSPHTVRNQLSAALRKLGLKSRYEVAAAMLQKGAVP